MRAGCLYCIGGASGQRYGKRYEINCGTIVFQEEFPGVPQITLFLLGSPRLQRPRLAVQVRPRLIGVLLALLRREHNLFFSH